MIAACDNDLASVVIMGPGVVTVQEDEQEHTIKVEYDFRMIGTDLGSITSSNAILWSQGGCLVVLENLTVEARI
jgi:hypothetical protein